MMFLEQRLCHARHLSNCLFLLAKLEIFGSSEVSARTVRTGADKRRASSLLLGRRNPRHVFATNAPSAASLPPVTASSFQIDIPEALIARAKSRDLGAFEQIYRRFERPVFTLALRMLNDAEAAREVLHDAMLKVFQHIAQYRSDAPFWGWLRQIALNEALMRLRRERHFDTDGETDHVASDEAPPWVRADSLALERALGKLPAQTRSVLWMYHVEGYSHPEIADMVGKTVSFSKSQVARGTARLRDLLEPKAESVSCMIITPQLG